MAKKRRPAAKKTGRLSSFTKAKGDRICNLIAAGKSLRQIAGVDGIPPRQTILDWLHAQPAFSCQYARARKDQADLYAEMCIEIASSAKPESVQVSRLQVDVLKWTAAKLRPKRWGDRLELAGDPDAPIVTIPKEFTVTILPPGFQFPQKGSKAGGE
jgi:hypothetical protein